MILATRTSQRADTLIKPSVLDALQSFTESHRMLLLFLYIITIPTDYIVTRGRYFTLLSTVPYYKLYRRKFREIFLQTSQRLSTTERKCYFTVFLHLTFLIRAPFGSRSWSKLLVTSSQAHLYRSDGTSTNATGNRGFRLCSASRTRIEVTLITVIVKQSIPL